MVKYFPTMTCRITKQALKRYREAAAQGRVVVFDTETTGISRCDEIVEIAAAEFVAGELTRSIKLYVSPTCPMNPAAEAVHGLSLDFLAENGCEPTRALERFFEFLGDDVLLVAHNLAFDYRILQNECRKFDFSTSIEHIDFCDTLAMARKVVPGLERYRLSYLIEALGLKGDNSHDALDDTLACAELFFDLVGRIK